MGLTFVTLNFMGSEALTGFFLTAFGFGASIGEADSDVWLSSFVSLFSSNLSKSLICGCSLFSSVGSAFDLYFCVDQNRQQNRIRI